MEKGVVDEKKELRVKDVREYLEETLGLDELDPPINRTATLVGHWDDHYFPLLESME